MFYYYEGHLPWKVFQESQAKAVNKESAKYVNGLESIRSNGFIKEGR